MSLSFRIWSIHLQRGRPGRRFQLESGGRPSDKLTWVWRAWCAGTSSFSLAICTKTTLRRREMISHMDDSPVIAVISSLPTNWCHLTFSICLYISCGRPLGSSRRTMDMHCVISIQLIIHFKNYNLTIVAENHVYKQCTNDMSSEMTYS